MLEQIPHIILSWLGDLVETIAQWLVVYIGQTLPSKMADLLPQQIIDLLNTEIAFSLAGFFDMIMWFYPLQEVVAIFTTTYTAILMLRIVRYTVGFIPGVEG
ncbi:MAG: hypothetical protein ACF8MF_06030 [Phycisphaerales bacterium JB052]